ncbi:helix-turn-helix domain-containing protein [Macrococcus capreoli]|uniref:helix-turn-helix domain-containing protein n=1 Tax=Macrococcus capreoli TaxID=2982690 RepID=UPI003EE6D5BB
MNIGYYIKERRQEIGMTQKELSEGICTQSQISKIEKNEMVPLSTLLMDIAKRLNLSLDEIAGIKHSDARLHGIDKEKINHLLLLRNYEEISVYIALLDYGKLSHDDTIYLQYIKLVLRNMIQNEDTVEAMEILYADNRHTIDLELKVNILNSMANLYLKKHNYLQARTYFKEALSLIYSHHLTSTLCFKVIYNFLRLLYEEHEYKEMYDLACEAIDLSHKEMNMICISEFIYSKNTALLKLNSTNLIDEGELSFAKYLAKKQKKIELLNLFDAIELEIKESST